MKPELSDLSMALLFLSLLAMFLGVRTLTKDEHLYLRLYKLGKFDLVPLS
jgi:hypothetical protein